METDKRTDEVNGAAAAAAPDIEEIERLAEERGYLRGRNERIEELMGEPGIWQPAGGAEPVEQQDPGPTLLSGMRRDIWDSD